MAADDTESVTEPSACLGGLHYGGASRDLLKRAAGASNRRLSVASCRGLSANASGVPLQGDSLFRWLTQDRFQTLSAAI